MDKRLAKILITFTTLLITATSWAAHPLITDDTGTQGKGKFQLELNGQYDRDKENIGKVSVKATGFETVAPSAAPTVSSNMPSMSATAGMVDFMGGWFRVA